MSPLDLAFRYMDVVYGGEPLGRLREVLADPFRFEGPLAQYDRAAAYIEALEADPPTGFRYELVAAYTATDSACLVYRFRKPGVDQPMAQRFVVRDGRIHEILLIFDASAFREAAVP